MTAASRYTNVVLCSLLGALAGSPAMAQSVRVSGITTFQYLDVRPLEDDSIPIGEAQGSGLLRRSGDGDVVRCLSESQFCHFRRPAGALSTLPAVQDINVNAWGFGRGMRAYARLRGRGMVLGDDAVWPRADDRFDLLAGYVEMNRAAFSARLGRQWITGLGYHNFDGGSFVVRPAPGLSAEAYGGRSLARALNEPLTTGELLAVESFAPNVGAYLIGARVSARPRRGAAFNLQYRRELRTDRLGLYSERVGLDGVVRVGRLSVDGALKVDWATGTWNEGRLRLWLPSYGPWSVNVYARHHDPFFELWSIWGAFSPLAFKEAGASAAWRRPEVPLTFDLWMGGRRYTGASADDLFGGVRSTGWRAGGSLATSVVPDWVLQLLYRMEIGFGAAKSDGAARLQRTFGNGSYVAISTSAFQQLYEFRIDEGTVLGLGADGAFSWRARTKVRGSLTAYRHGATDGLPGAPWTQLRGALRVEWTVGPEPGVVSPSGGRQ